MASPQIYNFVTIHILTEAVIERRNWNSIKYPQWERSNEQSLDELGKSLIRFNINAKSSIIIAGNFNLPGWECKTKTLKDNTPYPKIHTNFKDILDDNSLIQMVEKPTRGENTLDFILTETITGISGTMILSSRKLILRPKRKYKKHEVFHYTKNIKSGLSSTLQQMRDFERNNVGATIMWEYFKKQLEELIKIHIPHKIARRKDIPWIASSIKKLIKKR